MRAYFSLADLANCYSNMDLHVVLLEDLFRMSRASGKTAIYLAIWVEIRYVAASETR